MNRLAAALGDPVRARVPGARRLVRGVLSGVSGGQAHILLGLRSVTVPVSGVTIIRRRGERELTLARVRAIRKEAALLSAARGNKLLAGGEP